MATALPAMKGQFGSTEYYLITMRANDLANTLVIPKELEDWEDLSLEERFQREVNYNRVKQHIAPYLANDEDRFFGAFIVDIYNHEGVEFEPLEQMIKSLPSIYKKAGQTFGYLHLQGNEVLVPLDGQHRLAALRFAISGRDEKGKEIEGLTPNMDIANDHCTVILVKHDTKKARKIFNKVNRYAKSTTKADNLITADDDIVAVITREEVADKIIHERLVNYHSNTLSKNSVEFTTLSTLYEATGLILEDYHGKIDRTTLPSKADEKLFRRNASDFWNTIINDIKLFSIAVHDPKETGDDKRKEIRQDYTLGKPIVQLAIVDAILRMHEEDDYGKKISLKDICDRINRLDWRVDNQIWQNVLMKGNKVVTGKQAAKFAARFIAYLLGQKLHSKELEALENQYLGHFSDEHMPDGLPEPFFK